MRPIDADALKEEIDKVLFDGSQEHEITEALELIDELPTLDTTQKVVVVQPEIIKSVADAIVDTIYKLDWMQIIKFYRGGSVKGEWIKDDIHNTVCSVCGGIRRDSRFDHIDFCNKCGADMRGEE